MLRDRLIFLVSVLQPYSQGGMVIVLTSSPVFIKTNNHHSSLTVRGIWVSNPISYSHLRFSASIISRKKAFALSIPLSIYGYHPYSKYYLVFPLFDSSFNLFYFYLRAFFKNKTFKAAYIPFTPD